jgi:uncharacterized protein
VTRPDGPLVFPLAGLLADPPGASRTLAVGPARIDLGESLELARPVEGRLKIARTNRGVLVRADLRSALATQCSRCLRPVEAPLELTIDEEVLPSVELASGAPADVASEPDAVRLTERHELDLEPLVRDAIGLAEPIAPLCRPDCPGLCEVCGADLSEPGHVDHEEEPDPRLAVLGSFMVDAERETD